MWTHSGMVTVPPSRSAIITSSCEVENHSFHWTVSLAAVTQCVINMEYTKIKDIFSHIYIVIFSGEQKMTGIQRILYSRVFVFTLNTRRIVLNLLIFRSFVVLIQWK